MIGLPRSYLRRGWRSLRGRDDYPGDLLAAEVCGTAAGIPAWGFSRWPGR
jgi:hypothetical protein